MKILFPLHFPIFPSAQEQPQPQAIRLSNCEAIAVYSNVCLHPLRMTLCLLPLCVCVCRFQQWFPLPAFVGFESLRLSLRLRYCVSGMLARATVQRLVSHRSASLLNANVQRCYYQHHQHSYHPSVDGRRKQYIFCGF